ncbi:MAG TPA: ATP-grasp domain-containing protein [Gemmatimonadaceae bacterium]|nr:ATP-grasp domain-containing protein [Gemmatimonadaceae bacterium]
MPLISGADQARPLQARVLVTDGEQRAALAIVRSLGRTGHRVFVQSSNARSLAGVSRFTARELVMPGARDDPTAFATRVADEVRRNQIDVIIPVTDAALQTLLPARDAFLPATIPFGSAESHAQLSDKSRVIECAASFGITVPEQRYVTRREELVGAVTGALRFPVVLKPSCSVRMQNGRLCKLDVVYANDRKSLERLAATLDDAAFPLLAQERIVGSGLAALFLMWDGRAIARFAHRRIRERPPSGGEMTYGTSASLDPQLAEQSEALLRAADWRGPAMVEFKIDNRTGVPYLMEVNARFWGGLQLAIDSGVDFPGLLVRAALGDARRDQPEYAIGRRMRWFWGDVDHLAVRMRHSAERLNLQGGRMSRARSVAAFVATTLRAETDAVFRLDDPRPFARESREWLSSRRTLFERALRERLAIRPAASAARESAR